MPEDGGLLCVASESEPLPAGVAADSETHSRPHHPAVVGEQEHLLVHVTPVIHKAPDKDISIYVNKWRKISYKMSYSCDFTAGTNDQLRNSE